MNSTAAATPASSRKPGSRAAREAAVRDVCAQMQRAIDEFRNCAWEAYYRRYAEVNPYGLRFVELFDAAWRRSMLPNVERDDMDADGNYR